MYLKPLVVPNSDSNTSKTKNYTSKPQTFSGDSTEFEWWKSKMYTHILGVDDELWDILEDYIYIHVDGIRMVADKRASLPLKRKLIENITECVAFW